MIVNTIIPGFIISDTNSQVSFSDFQNSNVKFLLKTRENSRLIKKGLLAMYT